MSGHGGGELCRRRGVASLDHEQKLAGFGTKNDSHVTIHAEHSSRRPECDGTPTSPGRYGPCSRDDRSAAKAASHPDAGLQPRHLSAEATAHNHRVHPRSKPAAASCPRHTNSKQSMLSASHSQHPRRKFGALMPEFRMPPSCLHGVMHWQKFVDDRGIRTHKLRMSSAESATIDRFGISCDRILLGQEVRMALLRVSAEELWYRVSARRWRTSMMHSRGLAHVLVVALARSLLGAVLQERFGKRGFIDQRKSSRFGGGAP